MPAASDVESVLTAMRDFGQQVHHDADLGTRIDAGPEDQLKASIRPLVKTIGDALGLSVSVLSESSVDDVGRPDLAIAVNGLLVGYIELKAPGVGTTDRDFRGRNKTQLNKSRKLPNLIYTDANDWTYYCQEPGDEKAVECVNMMSASVI